MTIRERDILLHALQRIPFEFLSRIVDVAPNRRRGRESSRAGNHLGLVLAIRAKATDRKYPHGPVVKINYIPQQLEMIYCVLTAVSHAPTLSVSRGN